MALGVRQYDRGVRLTVVPPLAVGGGVNPPVVINPIPPPGGGAPALPQIHVRFQVSKSLTPEPQRATVTVWNLAKTTRDSIAGASRRVVDWIPGGVPTPLVKVDGRLLPSDPVVVDTTSGVAHMILEAGYGGVLSSLFAGVAAPVINKHVGGIDWRTTLHGGDSELGLTQGQANKTFNAGTPASAVLAYLASTLGLVVAPTAAAASLSAFILQAGLVAVGRARDGLRDLLEGVDLTWWVEDGTLWILGDGEFIPGPPVLVSPEDIPGMHRLLESPMRVDDNGVRVRLQLAPEVRPGHQIVIASSELAGVYRIEDVLHSGDNRSGPFETAATVRTQNPLGL